MGMMQQMFASFQTTAGAPGVTTDSLFEYVSLLLSVNTTPFSADASTSNLALTPSGVVRNDVFTPFSTDGNYSVLFNGSTDALTTPATAGFGTNDFTVEAWIYVSSFATMNIWTNTAGSGATGVQTYISATGKLGISTLTTTLYTGLTTIPLNAWTHVAFTRTSGSSNMKGWINGTLDTISTNSTNMTDAQPMRIGRLTTSGQYFTGYISNLRVVNGTAVYTSGFTPSTTPLTAITNTILLACQSARFKDNSTNAAALTVAGTPKVKYAAPFVYANTYGSAYFNGTTDALTTPTTSGFGTNDFTVEAWVYISSFVASNIWTNTAVSGTSGIQTGINATGKLGVSTVTTSLYTGLTTLPLNAWTHVAFTRTGGNIKGWINGTLDTTAANSSDFSDAQPMRIGRLTTSGQYFTGYISNLRVVNGTAVYTSNFTPSTTPLTAITNTTLLTCQNQSPATNVGFVDSSENDYVLVRAGTPQQGIFSPFCNTGWSTLLGVGNYLTTSDASAFGFGTSGTIVPFTIECWFNMSASQATDQTLVTNYVNSASGWSLQIATGTNTLRFSLGDVAKISGNTSLIAGVWYHVAVTCEATGNNAKLFLNGVLDKPSTTLTGNTAGTNLSVGRILTVKPFVGYISNLRVLNGTALYTADFTPPSTPLTAITNTALLTLQDNRFKDNSINAFTLTSGGTPQVHATSPFAPAEAYSVATNSGSTYFNGSTDYLTTASSSNFAYGTGNFTIEFWAYPTASVNGGVLYGQPVSGTNYCIAFLNTNNTIVFYDSNSVVTTTTDTLKLNSWNHVALVRNAGIFTIYIQGVGSTGVSSTYDYTNTTNPIVVGRYAHAASNGFAGYISNLRVVKGTAVYTAAFTPPAAPLTAISGTSLLLMSTNAGVIDYSGRNNISTLGPATLSPSLIKYGAGSIMFNGTTDYIRIRNTPAVDLSVGDWTLEMWVYKTQNNGNSSRLWNPDGDSYDAMVLSLNATGGVAIQATTASGSWNVINTTFGSTLNNSQWYHVAVVRSGTDLYGFLNGVRTVLTTSCPTTLYNSVVANKVIGGQSGVARMLYGSINDFRITKGVARYTANFTPPTTSLPLY